MPKKYDESEGVWRTISGRKVFIRTGQKLSEAMRESGKFPSYNGKENLKDKTRITKEELDEFDVTQYDEMNHTAREEAMKMFKEDYADMNALYGKKAADKYLKDVEILEETEHEIAYTMKHPVSGMYRSGIRTSYGKEDMNISVVFDEYDDKFRPENIEVQIMGTGFGKGAGPNAIDNYTKRMNQVNKFIKNLSKRK